jgi:hypothetical protein
LRKVLGSDGQQPSDHVPKPAGSRGRKGLDENQASQFLLEHCGIRKEAPRTLQKARCTGMGGPPFYGVGGRCLYDEEVLTAWAAEQRSPYATSTSQLDILRTRAKAA